MKKKFNKSKYDIKKRKELEKQQFNTDLSIHDYEKIQKLIKEKGLNKALLLRITTNNLERGMLKMRKCDEIKDFLKGKSINVEFKSDFELGNYPDQEKEDSIELDDGYLFYIINKNGECNISLSKRTNKEDVNDEFLDDEYFEGYFKEETLDKLLDLIK